MLLLMLLLLLDSINNSDMTFVKALSLFQFVKK